MTEKKWNWLVFAMIAIPQALINTALLLGLLTEYTRTPG